MLELRMGDRLNSLEVKVERTRSALQASINAMQKWMAGLVVSVLLGFIGMSAGFVSIANQIAARQPQVSTAPPPVESAIERRK